MNKEIEVFIKEVDEKAYLVFSFDEPIELDITSDDKESILRMFYSLLSYIESKNDFCLKFVKKGNDLYNNIAEKYVANLETELNSLKEKYYK